MKRRSRGPLIGGLAWAMMATLGGMEALPDRNPAGADRTASAQAEDGLLSRLGNAARDLVNGGPRRAKPEVVAAGLARNEKSPTPVGCGDRCGTKKGAHRRYGRRAGRRQTEV